MNKTPHPNLGHFLTYDLWLEALRLLDFQVTRKKVNRHYNTLSMFNYERLGDEIRILERKEYFEEKVANNLFYGLQKEFAVYPYMIPKAGFGLRNYKFFSYPLRCVYYAIGLYLQKLFQECESSYSTKGLRIKSFYGAKLQFGPDGLIINAKNTFYKRYYKTFKNEIRKEVRLNKENKLLIRLDIQNYFDEVSIPVLLDLIEEYAKPSIRMNLSFDPTTKDQIAFFSNSSQPEK